MGCKIPPVATVSGEERARTGTAASLDPGLPAFTIAVMPPVKGLCAFDPMHPSTLVRFRSGRSGMPRRAMTLAEMVIVIFVIAIALFLLVGWMNAMQQAAKRDLAVRLLADLDLALARYHRATGCYPTSYGPDSAIQATLDLLDHDKTRPIMESLPATVWREPERRHLVDPWGTPLRYYGVESNSPWVKVNGGRPVLVSAGPDRDFGDEDPAAAGDNLRSDDPGPEGFRLQHALREAAIEKEPSDGKEND